MKFSAPSSTTTDGPAVFSTAVTATWSQLGNRDGRDTHEPHAGIRITMASASRVGESLTERLKLTMKQRAECVVPLLLAVIVAGSPFPRSQPFEVAAVEAVGMTVSDLDRSVDFYETVLSFEKVSEAEVSGNRYAHLQGVFGLRMRVARLQLGDETIELTEYLTPKGRPYPVDSKSNDGWFQHIAIIVADMERAYGRLHEHKVEHVSPNPQRLPDWNPNAGGIEAFYFKDPDGRVLEVLEFPPDKGDPKWHRPGERLFGGINHTAIVVADTQASLRFYRDVLGMQVTGESENYGPEQERLNNVPGARLRITALRAPRGPGVEFLEHLSPLGGRPMPADQRANDLFHWRTQIAVDVVEPAASVLLAAGTPLVSRKGAGLRQGCDGSGNPDGHVLELAEK